MPNDANSRSPLVHSEQQPKQQSTSQASEQEWIALHQGYERSEGLSLALKLLAVTLCVTGFLSGLQPAVTSALLLVLWLQDAIWKTFQGRTEQRLLAIEKLIKQDKNKGSFQFYSQWSESRPSTFGLMAEYGKNALRPTVAYPYAVLVAITLFVA